MMLLAADRPVDAAGVFTTNRVKGAPVIVSKRHLRKPKIQGIICNSGISNVCMGDQGLTDAKQMCALTAKQLGCRPQQVLACSTGVIGVPLPMDLITRGIATVGPRLTRGQKVNAAAARAILTTDLVTKTASRRLRLGGKTVHLAGMCKGSGMIAPNMATMLAFITTDTAIAPGPLNDALRAATRASFNRISVDTDQSTSDSILILAGGAAGNARIRARGRAFSAFTDALTDLCRDLAHQLVADGEGATRIFCVTITGARSERDADRVGRAVVESPLVKTAVHGADPNWGRILMAAGKSGAALKPDRLSLHIGPHAVLRGGQPIALNRTAQRKLARYMKHREIEFTLDLAAGRHTAQWTGCDLSRQYIAINADYTT